MYSKGISWINDCRIPFVDEVVRINTYNDGTFDPKNNLIGISQKGKKFDSEYESRGRFPANILVSDDMLNDGVISKSGERKTTGIKKDKTFKNIGDLSGGFNDKGSNSRYYDIDKWFNKILE